jgi:hypothetical protein
MTITAVNQSPQTYSPAYNENMYLVSSSGTAQTNFKYIFDVYATDGVTRIARVKLPARPVDSRGLFDAKRIIENYLSYDLPTAQEAAGFYRNDNSFYKYSVKIGEEYGDPVTVYAAQQTVSGKYIWNSALDWQEFIDFLYTDYILTKGLTGHPFLTNAPATQRIELNQNAWLYMATASSGSVQTAQFKKYNSSGSLLGTLYITNPYYDLTGSEAHRFVRLGTGPANLNAHTASWIDSNVSYYTAQVLDSTSGTASTAMRYDMTENCRFTTVRLHWLNKLGGFDSFNFTLKSRESLAITKQQYKKRYGNTTGTTWGYESYERGDVVFDSRSKQSFKITSDWISEAESEWLEELLTSPEVYVETAVDKLTAIVVKDSKYDKRKKVNERLFNLELEYEYSFEKIRQRG